ncbi:hypothetical protein TNCV_4322411 [Trichonephila clavipes]|uniref:Uncharacterized protein n=1 Tax=Trichonephila clavipes TaxID=2585209 RepID=A0A8X6VJ31_TRICX|nr:hypothetical protein TNCV_4322411 [Trichonephila clavipes]
MPEIFQNVTIHGFLHKGLESSILSMAISPAGWRSWFVAGLLYPKLRVRPQLKSVDFPVTQNRQRPCHMIIRHEKDPLSVLLALGKFACLSTNFASAQLRGLPLGKESK